MAALAAGVQYGLSSHSKITENKSLIFVKLTDSAQRAIEDFLRNRNKTNQNPTIQFLGNEGQLSFPSTQSSHGSAGFTFSLSGNQDIEGPQGGFECIQQTGPKSLESLGTLPCKMRIQANDDVYETTRHRMAVAEENNKNKCTRVIKANGPDIGRKVKVKATGRTIPPPIPNVRHRESASIPTSSSQSSRSQPSAPPAAPSTTSSSTTSSSSFSSYKPIQNSNPPPNRTQPEKKVSDLMRRPLRERLIHLLALRPYKRPELYNRITTEGIKERDRSTTNLVLKQVAFMRDNTYHLLRHVWNDVQEDWPFYTEQEKAMLKRRKPQNLTPPGSSDGGSSGSGQSPNSTHAGSPPAITAPPPGLMNLKRPGYYQSADGLQTKKPRISHFRKSDSSTTAGSGNSNGNRENARTAGNSSSGGGGGGGNNGQVAGPPSSGGSGSVVVSGSGLGSSGSVGSENSSWEHRQQQQQQQQQRQLQQQPQQQQQQHRERADYRAERTTNSDVLRSGSYGSAKSCLTPTSDSEDNNHSGLGHNNHHNNTNATSGGTGANSSTSSSNNGSGNHNIGTNHYSNSSLSYNNNPTSNHHHSVNGNSSKVAIGGESNSAGSTSGGSLGLVNFVRSSTGGGGGSANSLGSNGSPNGTSLERRDREDRGSSRAFEREREREREREIEREYERDRESRENISAAGTNSYNDFPNPGASGNSANIVGTINSPPTSDNGGTTEDSEYPDYLTCYTTISSVEQRRRYKNEFSADYEEYRTLHTEVGRVAEKFTLLEAQWRRELQNGNHERTQAIKNQIMQAYAETRNDPVHKKTKKRFDYLHKKLSHIKQLVHEYDTKNLSGNGGAGGGGGGNGNGGTDVGLRGGLRN